MGLPVPVGVGSPTKLFREGASVDELVVLEVVSKFADVVERVIEDVVDVVGGGVLEMVEDEVLMVLELLVITEVVLEALELEVLGSIPGRNTGFIGRPILAQTMTISGIGFSKLLGLDSGKKT